MNPNFNVLFIRNILRVHTKQIEYLKLRDNLNKEYKK
jgi:hypothetical protein